MIILGIETSCDETSVAVVEDGRRVRANAVLSQADLHSPWGGVVPEIASRQHSEMLPSVVRRALREADLAWDAVDAVAATYGPGLASSLLVGLSMAKGLAMRLNRPLAVVNHLQAHMYSPFLSPEAPSLESATPFVALVISGGHTCLVRWEGVGRYRLLGETIDDAAGEAFDKGAKLLGLGYPGGPIVDRLARGGDPAYVAFPRGVVRGERFLPAGADPRLCFSFSGVKTALRTRAAAEGWNRDHPRLADVVASYQEAIVDAVIARCERALDGANTLAVGGGVSLNSRLRARLQQLAEARGVRLLLAPPAYCADNAAMIAGLAGVGGGRWGAEAQSADATPSLSVCAA